MKNEKNTCKLTWKSLVFIALLVRISGLVENQDAFFIMYFESAFVSVIPYYAYPTRTATLRCRTRIAPARILISQ